MIDRDDWLAAVHAAQNAPLPESDAITVSEFSKLIGLERCQSAVRLKRMLEAGMVEATTKLVRRINGQVVSVPAYRLLKGTREISRARAAARPASSKRTVSRPKRAS